MRNITLLTALQLCGRGAQFVLFFIISACHGVEPHTDAVFLAYAPVSMILAVGAGIADTVLIPAVHINGGMAAAGLLVRSTSRLTLPIVAVTALISVTSITLYTHISPYAAVLLFTAAVTGNQAYIFSGILNGGGYFYRVAISPIFGAICGSLPTLLLPASDISLAAAFASYEFARLIFLYCARTYLHSKHGCESTSIYRWISRNSLFQALGSVCTGAVPLIHMSFANQLGHGFITYIEYANRYWQIAPLLFSAVILTGFQTTSRLASNQEINIIPIFKHATKLGFFGLFTGIIFACFYSIALPVAYKHNLRPDEIKTVVLLVSIMLIATAPYVASMVCIRAFAVLGQHEVIFFAAIFNIITSTAIDFFLLPTVGVYAIAISITASQVLTYCLIGARMYALGRKTSLKTSDTKK